MWARACALSPPQTSPLRFSHWRSSHSQILPWMRVSPGGWHVHCPHRHWPTKKAQTVLTTLKVLGMSFTWLQFHTDTADVRNGRFCTRIEPPDKMSPVIEENLYANHSLLWTLTPPCLSLQAHTHTEKHTRARALREAVILFQSACQCHQGINWGRISSMVKLIGYYNVFRANMQNHLIDHSSWW